MKEYLGGRFGRIRLIMGMREKEEFRIKFRFGDWGECGGVRWIY